MIRMAVESYPLHAAKVLIFWPKPDINSELSDVRDSKCFCGVCFCNGYWQLPLEESSQPLHAFMTPCGVVQLTRTTRGAIKYAANLQQKVESCFAELRDIFKAWIDHFVVYTKNEKQLLAVLRRFFELCCDHSLVTSLPNSTFFANSIRWCGCIIGGNGYRHHPANYEALKNTEDPTNAAELCQFVHAAT